eukprot:8044460-Heterocapsa_arctica.AAC.1
MRGVHAESLDGRVNQDLLDYVRDVASHGVRTRLRGPACRLRARTSPTMREFIHEGMGIIWGDAAKGRL